MAQETHPADPLSAESHTARPTTAQAAKAWYAREDLLLGGVILATLLVYLRSVGNEFVFNDRALILNNHFIVEGSFLWKSLVNDLFWFRDPSRLPQSSYYRPLVSIWLWLNFQLFNINTDLWHAAVVPLHLIVVALVYKVAAGLSDDRRVGLLAALLFGLMPVHAEAVSWVSSAAFPLSAALELAAFDRFMRRADAPRGNLVLALVFFAAALMSHESAVAFPAIVFFYGLLLELPGGEPARDTGPKLDWSRIEHASLCAAPYVVELVAYLVVRTMVLGSTFSVPGTTANPATGAQGLFTIPSVLAADLELLALPWLAAPAHRVLLVTSPLAPAFYVPLLVLSMLAVGFLLFMRKYPRRNLCLFLAAWTVLALLPQLNLQVLRRDMLVQDRYLYLASVAWCVILADLVAYFAHAGELAGRIAWGAAAAIAALYAVMLWNVQSFWQDGTALYTGCVQEFPESAICHGNLGIQLKDRGDLSGAERELKAALDLSPSEGRFLYDLGFVHFRLGHPEAVQEMAKGLSLQPQYDPLSYAILGQLFDQAGDHKGSEELLKYAESLPGGVEAVTLVRSQMAMGRNDAAGAEKTLRDFIAHNPKVEDFRIWQALGRAQAQQGRYKDALASYQNALQRAPSQPIPHYFAALALHAMGRDREAYVECSRVLARVPDEPSAKALMAEIQTSLANAAKPAEAKPPQPTASPAQQPGKAKSPKP